MLYKLNAYDMQFTYCSFHFPCDPDSHQRQANATILTPIRPRPEYLPINIPLNILPHTTEFWGMTSLHQEVGFLYFEYTAFETSVTYCLVM